MGFDAMDGLPSSRTTSHAGLGVLYQMKMAVASEAAAARAAIQRGRRGSLRGRYG
jgi:hypothetical protein